MNAIESLLPAPFAQAVAATLMHSLWQLSALGVLLYVVLALVPKASPRLRYLLAVGTQVLMLSLPMGTLAYLYDDSAAPVSVRPPLVVSEEIASYVPVSVASSAGLATRLNQFLEEQSYLLMALWAAGALILALRLGLHCLRLYQLRRTGTLEAPTALRERFWDLAAQMGIGLPVQLRLSSRIDTPVLLGTFKPLVLLPMGMLSGLSPEQVECILIHELGHVRRWDFLVNLLQSIAEVVLFYHPGIWWVSRQVRIERENCCDALVLAHKADKLQYARALLNLEMLRQQPALSLSAGGGDLQSRIRQITGGALPRNRKALAQGLALGLLSTVLLLVVAFQSQSVVKAALPMLGFGAPESPLGSGFGYGRYTNGEQMVFPVEIVAATQDSPITKVTIIDNGTEVTLNYDSEGNVASGTKNGQAIPKAELEGYQAQTDAFFQGQMRGLAPLPNLGSLTPPPVPNFGPVPPMPPMPRMGNIPPLPPMPNMPSLPGTPGDFNEKEFEQQMKEFGKAMEAWGKDFEQQMDKGEWDKYGEEMRAWSYGWAAPGDEFVKEEQERMQRLREEISKTRDVEEREALEEELQAADEALQQHVEGKMDERMADFEARMEEWGEAFGRQMEQMEEEMERALEHDALAERDAEEAEEEARRHTSATDRISREVLEDGLARDPHNFRLRINDDNLEIDGKKQSRELHRKYMRLVEDALDVEVTDEWVTIHCRKR